MKPGLKPGIEAEFDVIVDSAMRPAFEGTIIHDVMSTVAMIYFMEKAGRDIILPFLEDGEEGAGFAIDVKHLGPAVVGQKVFFKAVCTSVTEKRVVCEVSAATEFNVVGKGIFTQAIFQKEEMNQRIRELEKKLKKES